MDSKRPEARNDRAWATVAAIAVAYGGLTVVMTWPVAIRPSVPYQAIWQDFGLWLWNLWWMKRALADLGISPYFTSEIFHPTGTSLVFHNLSPYNGLLGIPLQILGADLIMTHNLLYLSSFVIGGVGMFLLVRELTGNHCAGFLAGVVYAFCPFRILTYLWTNVWATQWIPFALLFAVRLLRGGRSRDGVGLSVSLALTILSDWHQPVFVLLAIGVLALSARLDRKRRPGVAPGAVPRLIWSLGLSSLLVLPLGHRVLRELAAGDAILQTASVDLGLGLLGTGPSGDLVSYGVILGWVPLALMVYGFARGLDVWMRGFLGLLIGFFILSLGEGLRVPGAADPVLPLPFALWRRIPLLGIIRNTTYFWIMVQVCFAVLVGHGMRRLCERIAALPRPNSLRRRAVVGAGLLGLTLLEAFQGPLPARPFRLHPVYEAIREDPSGGAILDAPIGYTMTSNSIPAGRSMFLQSHHQRPLIGGYTQFDAHTRLGFLAAHPILNFFMVEWEPLEELFDLNISGETLEAFRSFLYDYRVRWIVLHKRTRDSRCDQPRIARHWSPGRPLVLVAPAVLNRHLKAWWEPDFSCWGWGDWDAGKALKAEALVRRLLGVPVWDDAELVAFQVR